MEFVLAYISRLRSIIMGKLKQQLNSNSYHTHSQEQQELAGFLACAQPDISHLHRVQDFLHLGNPAVHSELSFFTSVNLIKTVLPKHVQATRRPSLPSRWC